MIVSLIAALKALPELVKVIGQLGETFKRIEEERIDNKFTKLQGKVDEYTKKIENATTNEERSALARSLNNHSIK